MEKNKNEEPTLGRNEKKQLFIDLRAKGYSYASIAHQLHMSKTTLLAWNAELKKDISMAKAKSLQHLQENHFLIWEKRIESLGEKLKSIHVELVSRDLSNIDTAKLLELFLKYHTVVTKEYNQADPLNEQTAYTPHDIFSRKIDYSNVDSFRNAILAKISGKNNGM